MLLVTHGENRLLAVRYLRSTGNNRGRSQADVCLFLSTELTRALSPCGRLGAADSALLFLERFYYA